MQGNRRRWSGGSAGDYIQLTRGIRAVIRVKLDVEAERASNCKSGGKLTLAIDAEGGI
jgi:hypothetical protein